MPIDDPDLGRRRARVLLGNRDEPSIRRQVHVAVETRLHADGVAPAAGPNPRELRVGRATAATGGAGSALEVQQDAGVRHGETAVAVRACRHVAGDLQGNARHAKLPRVERLREEHRLPAEEQVL